MGKCHRVGDTQILATTWENKFHSTDIQLITWRHTMVQLIWLIKSEHVRTYFWYTTQDRISLTLSNTCLFGNGSQVQSHRGYRTQWLVKDLDCCDPLSITEIRRYIQPNLLRKLKDSAEGNKSSIRTPSRYLLQASHSSWRMVIHGLQLRHVAFIACQPVEVPNAPSQLPAIGRFPD